MKNRKYLKLLSIAISTLFIIGFSLKAEEHVNLASINQGHKVTQAEALAHSIATGASSVENGSINHPLHQNAKVPGGRMEVDYWIEWKNQFLLTLTGNGSLLLPGKTGC